MTWEEKLFAMQSLPGGSFKSLLSMSRPGLWKCMLPAEIGGDGFLHCPSCTGLTPEAAVNEAWRTVLALPNDKFLVVTGRTCGDRRHYRWSGFVWVEVPK